MSSRMVAAVAACVTLLGGCAVGPPAPPQPTRQPNVASRVVQFNYGQRAMFGACVEPACPMPTRKTVGAAQPNAVRGASPIAPAARAPGASSDPEGTL